MMRKVLKTVVILFTSLLFTGIANAANNSSLHSLYQPAGNAVAGNPNGSVTMVEFFDYNCGYCRAIYPNLKKLVASDNSIRLVFRDYPILSERSVLPAEAAVAANKQGKYLALHDAMMEAMMPLTQSEIVKLARQVGINTTQLVHDMASPEVVNQVKANLNEGQLLNIQGVPTFIVVRTTPPSTEKAAVVVGPSIADLKEMVEKAKKSA